MKNRTDAEKKERKHRFEKRLTAACILLAAAGILTVCADRADGFAEWYAQTLYPIWTGTLGRIAGGFPFSVSEAGLYLLPVLLIGTGVRAGIQVIRRKRDALRILEWAAGVFLTAAVLMFLYVVNCGINYNRESFSEKTGMETEEYTVEDLKQVCVWLTENVNTYADLVRRNEDHIMILSEDERKTAVQAMESLGEIYSCLSGYYPEPKRVMISEILSYQSLTGVYSPFTIEANYNEDMTAYNIPFTACHELSHLRGFMQEQEANFIAFLACEQSASDDFHYSGYLMAWIYSMNTLYRVDTENWQEVREGLCEEAEYDLQANSSFWDRYEGTVAEVSNKVNDTYLKANGQTDGVESYNRMVDLLVSYYKEQQADTK